MNRESGDILDYVVEVTPEKAREISLKRYEGYRVLDVKGKEKPTR